MQYYKSKNTNNNNSKKKRNKNSKANEVKKFAYLMGCVERGLKNPDSQISASYNRGKQKDKVVKKSLY